MHLVRFFVLVWSAFGLLAGCASLQKPNTEMVFASSAMKAAERAGAERRAPDTFNRAQTAMWRANRHYLAKEFELAKTAAVEARRLAERAELEAELRSLRNSRE
jgi:hypothetical protein